MGRVGNEEFLELARLWNYDQDTYAAIATAIEGAQPTTDPWLVRYFNPGDSRVDQLERLASEVFGVQYVLALHSGTSALETAYVACGIGPGDEVIVPAFTFFATAAAVISVGAIPVIADVDDSLTLDPLDVQRRITERTKAIVPVHMHGGSADMDALTRLAGDRALLVIEDVAQACGGTFKGRALGTFGTAGCFSLSSFKAVGAGEAGLLVTSDARVYRRALNHHDTGACWRDDRYARGGATEELFCGTNYRMSELEGAVNLVQLDKLRGLKAGLRRVYELVAAGLGDHEGVTPRRLHDIDGQLHTHMVLLVDSARRAAQVVQKLVGEGVRAWRYDLGGGRRDWHVYAYWEQLLEHKSASESGWPWSSHYSAAMPVYSTQMCPRALELVPRSVLVPLEERWTERECADVAAALNRAFARAGQ
jgi:dTDP-4-amino-4,6-dideoxygalactose transaminase